jgi:hypothetical protein
MDTNDPGGQNIRGTRPPERAENEKRLRDALATTRVFCGSIAIAGTAAIATLIAKSSAVAGNARTLALAAMLAGALFSLIGAVPWQIKKLNPAQVIGHLTRVLRRRNEFRNVAVLCYFVALIAAASEYR